jgi:exonuclease III
VIISTWNLNNRAGKARFRPEAAEAAGALGCDVLVLTEFYPQKQEQSFRELLAAQGFSHQLISANVPQVANQVLAVSRIPVQPLFLDLHSCDHQFSSNLLGFSVPSNGFSVLGVRVPAYRRNSASLLSDAWQWLQNYAESMVDTPAIILGDLNVALTSRKNCASKHFRHILESGWTRAQPELRATYFGHGGRKSEIDHLLVTRYCNIRSAEVVKERNGYSYAGSKTSISDHAVLQCNILAHRPPKLDQAVSECE